MVIKKNLQILFFFLFLITAFSQSKIDQSALNYKMLKTEDRDFKGGLTDQRNKFYEVGINVKDLRTTMNKTIHDSSFLLIESIDQYWYDYVWVDYSKSTYVYDENNNLIEKLVKLWDENNWVNRSKFSNTYD